jgi:hypothetical protein
VNEEEDDDAGDDDEKEDEDDENDGDEDDDGDDNYNVCYLNCSSQPAAGHVLRQDKFKYSTIMPMDFVMPKDKRGVPRILDFPARVFATEAAVVEFLVRVLQCPPSRYSHSLSLSLTHTHTHTHTLSLSLSIV